MPLLISCPSLSIAAPLRPHRVSHSRSRHRFRRSSRPLLSLVIVAVVSSSTLLDECCSRRTRVALVVVACLPTPTRWFRPLVMIALVLQLPSRFSSRYSSPFLFCTRYTVWSQSALPRLCPWDSLRSPCCQCRRCCRGFYRVLVPYATSPLPAPFLGDLPRCLLQPCIR